MSDEAPTSTITWFRGDCQAASEILQSRLGTILEANPWLSGRVMKRNDKLLLIYNQAKAFNLTEHFQCLSPKESPLSRDMPLDKQAKASSELLIVKNGPTQSLFQVSIVPCHKNPKTCFGVVVSLSHIIADGHTFYSIHNMLSGGDKVRPLIVERIADTHKTQEEAMGKEAYSLLKSTGFIISMIRGSLWTSLFPAYKCQQRGVYMDAAVMADAKKQSVCGY